MTQHHTLRRLAPACILLLVAGAACGSDDDKSTLTEAQYIEQANAVCAAGEEQLGPIFAEIFPKLDTATEAERQTATDGLLKVLGKQSDGLAALEIEVVDDGAHATPWVAGVGITSMSDRATEIGGVLSVGPAADGGGRVSARLPVLA